MTLITYRPERPPKSKNKSVSEIHHDLDDLTANEFNGISAKNGIVRAIIGDLSDADLEAIEDYLGVVVSPAQS